MTRSARVASSDADPEEEKKAEPATGAAALDAVTGPERPNLCGEHILGSPVMCIFYWYPVLHFSKLAAQASRQAAIMRAAAAA